MDEKQLFVARLTSERQIDKLAAQIVAIAVSGEGDPTRSFLRYVIDRLLGKAAVSADINTASPQDLEKTIDRQLKEYAAEVLTKSKARKGPPIRKVGK